MAGNAPSSAGESLVKPVEHTRNALRPARTELEVELLVVENFRAIFAPQSEPTFAQIPGGLHSA